MAKHRAPGSRTSVDELNGDLGQSHTPWSPEEGPQGISNRPDDETDAMSDGDESSDAGAFDPSNKDDEE